MQEINKILGKVWRNQDLTMEEIKILAENKLETVNKIEIKMYENKLVYVVFFENDARRYVEDEWGMNRTPRAEFVDIVVNL